MASAVDAVSFPADFVWGAATASYQIEGATKEDGRGPCIWDTFAATPGRVLNGDSGEPATDHYHLYRDDIALMKELGIGAYRFSVAWPRVQPDGKGRINPVGLDFYRRLVDELLEAGITPWPTLYHWDLPQPLEDDGGWPNRDTAYRFAEYAAVVHGALGDRVRHWNTLNEPWCSAFLGYAEGQHAPGRTEPAASIAAVHHLLLGHGLAIAAMREQQAQHGGEQLMGIVLNPSDIRPYSDREADVDAARRIDGLRNRIFLDPLFRGAYPEDVREDLAQVTDFGFVHEGDLAAISAPLDLLGVNFYNHDRVAGSTEGLEPGTFSEPGVPGATATSWVGSEHVSFVRSGYPRTRMGWEVDANGLYALLTRLAADYPGVELYVTENGAAYADTVTPDGEVHDPERLDYIRSHLLAAHRAIEDGVPLKGYFAWSLLDNYEWAWGYSQRFGIVYVDYGTQERIVKDSGRWYGSVARSGEVPAR
ncbi:glycoside hydrolase family 1 protein [Allonocardiopsis opalescens]|uniref:beta-glucosidase n=1 Tax=Allonocardiopsis opalescens TaxID=1144618 RepID=A0A2T0Q0A2_9ACTN|nr:beta-glucosidase [Allonocardiopsis opalescens]PRX97196.1 broad-specificity cellobiase [Allonocardiopsis opalescens]